MLKKVMFTDNDGHNALVGFDLLSIDKEGAYFYKKNENNHVIEEDNLILFLPINVPFLISEYHNKIHPDFNLPKC